MENKVCKNKKCLKPLPKGYKHKYCEACRNQHAQKMKNSLNVVEMAACLVVAIVTTKKINPKK